MMKITLEFTAVLNVHGVRTGDAFELSEGATVRDLLTALEIQVDHQRFVAPFVNGRKASPTTELAEGDRCYLSLPIGGG